MTRYFQGQQEAAYRERSASPSMADVASVPAKTKCCACGIRRTTKTGSYNKGGQFICGQCRPVFARIADVKNPASTAGRPRRD